MSAIYSHPMMSRFSSVNKSQSRCLVAPKSVSVKISQPRNVLQRLTPAYESRGLRSGVVVKTATSDPVTVVGDPVIANAEPKKWVLDLWQKAEAVCFDVDCTITVNDSLDLLAEFMGVGEECAAITNKAMDGSIDLKESLEERINLLNCTPSDVKRFLKAHPPSTRLTPGIESLIRGLKARGISVYLISGGFRELLLPLAKLLQIPPENVIANRMLWQWDDVTMEPTKLVGFDESEPTAHNKGKPEAIARIRQKFPYTSVVMVGDGITDLEAVQVSGGADLFIGYGGVVERPAVVAGADWYVTDWGVVEAALKRFKVAMIGSGAWACAAMCMIAPNAKDIERGDLFEEKVPMWVYEEDYEGRKLTEVINETHENPKYLPGASMGDNVVAYPNLDDVVAGADMLVICAPHQFVRGICKQLVGKVKQGAIAISLIKGMRVRSDGPQLISQMVSRYLNIDCCVLMGANIASGISKKEFSEAVIGYKDIDNARLFKKLIQRPYFRINLLPDVAGAEMCGTLKNIVAVAAGFVDGLDFGPNTKAAILREGLDEMRRFSKALYPSIRDDTFLESCGMADLVATCYGGRNRLVAMEYTKAFLAGKAETFESLEASLLNGQKLQGTLTSDEVQELLKIKGWEQDYPLFTTVNRIINKQLDPTWIVKYSEGALVPLASGAPPPPPAPTKAGKKVSSLTLTEDVDV